MVNSVVAVGKGAGKAADGKSEAGGIDSALEALADAELSAHGFALEGVRLFTNLELKRRILRDLLRSPRVSEDDFPQEALEYLIEQRIAQTLSGCGLTRLQKAVFGLYLRGFSVAEITVRLDLSRPRVSSALHAARNRRRKVRDP